MTSSSIIIVDDHQLFREGLKFILNEMDGIDIIGEAGNGTEFLHLIEAYKPDLAIIDIRMPGMDGIEATRKALELYPDIKIMIISMFGEERYYTSLSDMGVKGFILKDSDNEELKHAVNTILKGNSYFSQKLLVNLIKNKEQKQELDITRREREILTLICKGFSSYQIAEELNISERTVERHRSNLLQKTNSSNSISLAINAYKDNLVDI